MSDDSNDGDPIESLVIRGLSSERLFFEPEKSCSLVMHQQKVNNSNSDSDSDSHLDGAVYKESEALSMESNNPSEDFRRSMEEMVEAHELKDWKGLQDLLGCYLKINDKSNHGYIMTAFIDLLLNISFVTSSTSSATTTTTTSTSSSTCISSSTNITCSSTPSSPFSLPSSSSLTTPSMSSLLDNHNHKDNDEDDYGDDTNNSHS